MKKSISKSITITNSSKPISPTSSSRGMLNYNGIMQLQQTIGTYGKLYDTAIALGGGHLIIGDNVPFIAEDRIKPLLNPNIIALAKKGKAARPVSMTNFYHKLEHPPAQSYITDTNGDKFVGVNNWDMNATASRTVTFADLGLSPSTTYTITELYSGNKIGTFTGSYTRVQ